MKEFSIKKPMTINEIATSLYQLPSDVQFCHHLTTSFAAHKALDEAYENLNELKDDIIEKLIGYSGKRFTTLSLKPITDYSETMPNEVAKEIMDFGSKLETFASTNSYCDIENLAQEYSGVGAKLKYLLTLK